MLQAVGGGSGEDGYDLPASLLVQLMKPQAGMRVYDPTAGSGGMLIQSAQFVEEQGQMVRSLTLAGQDNNGTVWAICKMNMLLHNVLDADIHLGDTQVIMRVALGGLELREVGRIDVEHNPFGDHRNPIAAAVVHALDDGAGQRVHQ